MYLTDQEIRARLDDFLFESEDPAHPFDPDAQIGPCSVDLRISSQYWRLQSRWRRGRRPIAIGRISLEELAPRRQWKPHKLRETQVLRLKPGSMVLARTAERFTLPPGYAALVQGRSSYARLGLSVHPSAGVINPGWSGQFPLPLMNESDATLEVPPFTSIAQVLLIPLRDAPEQDYAARGSKYQQDDGGPSYWWRDKVLRELVSRLPGTVADNVIQDLGEALTDFPEDLVHALEDYLSKKRSAQFRDASALIEDFQSVERRKAITALSLSGIGIGGAGGLGTAAFTAAYPFPGAIFLTSAVGLLVWAMIWQLDQRKFFTRRALADLRSASVATSLTGGGSST